MIRVATCGRIVPWTGATRRIASASLLCRGAATYQFRHASSSSQPPQKDDTSDAGTSTSKDANVTVQDEKPKAISRVKRMPLLLAEEVPLPQKVMTDIQLLMKAWCDEHAEQYRNIMIVIRLLMFVIVCVLSYVFYRTILSSERTVRGNSHVPKDLNVGTVVFMDISENDRALGRVVIGLLTDKCPLYTEYFHRRCTGSGGTGDSFRGMTMSGMIPKHVAIFGEGRNMTHGVEGFNKNYLPTEYLATGPWRGCLSSICYMENKESPNFAIHLSSGDYPPQVFGIVLAGYDVVEKMGNCGVSLAGTPKKTYRIEDCGELCTLDKSNIVPLPWKLYENISKGYDEDRFGPRSDWASYYPTTGIMGGDDFKAYLQTETRTDNKPWWKLW
jgi:cyclophilin family peptidyl-prolyl cis-trans isomerase